MVEGGDAKGALPGGVRSFDSGRIGHAPVRRERLLSMSSSGPSARIERAELPMQMNRTLWTFSTMAVSSRKRTWRR